MKDLGRIRRLFYRDGVSLSEISRKTGYSRNTVKRWLKTPEGTEPKYRRVNPKTKIAPYVAQLIKALETDARRPTRDRRSALKLFGELQVMVFTGDYCRVTEFIRRWRSDGGTAVSKAYVPLHFELGEAFQFDWSEEHLVIGGVWRKILASHLKFCASRAFVVQAYPTQGHEMLFAAHTSAFAALGGNALTDASITPEAGVRAEGDSQLPNTFVPGRNLIFLTFAAALAWQQQLDHLVVGVAQTDYSGYPDCRDHTLQALEQALCLGMDRQILLHTPLMHLSKADTVRLAMQLGALPALAHSHTCYHGSVPPCGECAACQLRAKGFAEAGVAAHLSYREGVRAANPFAVDPAKWIATLTERLDEGDTDEFLEHVKLEMYSDQVFCFTPKGRIIALPHGATPLDFAYAVHLRLVGAYQAAMSGRHA